MQGPTIASKKSKPKRRWIAGVTKVAGVLFTLTVVSALLNILESNEIIIGINLGLRTAKNSEAKGNNRQCQPCDAYHRHDPELLIGPPMVFIRNGTKDLLDPVDGPLAFGSKKQPLDDDDDDDDDSSCPSCPAADIIMTFVDDSFLDTLSVWLHHYKSLDHSRRVLCLFALSDSSFHKMERLITTSASSEEKFRQDFGHVAVVRARTNLHKDVSTLWAYRVSVLSEFLHSFPFLNFYFTDLDAVWLRDPQPLLSLPPPPPLPDLNRNQSKMQTNTLRSTTSNIDIVASQGTFPNNCALLRQSKAKHQLKEIGIDGGTAVFGFIYFRNSPATRRLAADLAKGATAKTTKKFDDQRALNCRLYNQYKLSLSTSLNDGSFLLQYNPPPNKSNNTNDDNGSKKTNSVSVPLALRLLSGLQTVRHCDLYKNVLHQSATVAHCLSHKNGNSKFQQFRSYDLVPMNITMYDWEMASKADVAYPLGKTGGGNSSHEGGYFNDSRTAAFTLAVRRFQLRQSPIHHKTAKNLFRLSSAYGMGPTLNTHILNSVRVPKAGSSSLSIIARALAGCLPDGYPACMFPGDPPGSCPRTGLMCPRIKGHVDHRPNYDETNGRLPTITSLRDPARRLLSSFFYTKPHRPEPVSDHRWETFVKYIQMPTYRNVITKMLSGNYAYDPFDERIHTVEKAKGRLCKEITWFYIIGMETAGQLLLYETAPFDKLEPNSVVFDMPAVVISTPALSKEKQKVGKKKTGLRRELVVANQKIVSSSKNNYTVASDPSGKRHNDNSDYDHFRKNIFEEQNGAALIRQHNEEDFEVYEFARKLLCSQLGRSGILEAVVAAAADEDTTSVGGSSFHSLKERIQKEVEFFCPDGATTQPVELFCPL